MSEVMPPEEDLKKTRPRTVRSVVGLLLSLLIIAAAVYSAMAVYYNIRINPRTEDAQVRANVIGVAPQVGGSIVAIYVKDNQLVHKGDILFELDNRPYAAQAEQAKAQLALTELEIQAYKDQITAAEAQLRQSEAKATYAVDYAKRVQALVGNLYVTIDKNQLAQTEAITANDKVAQDKAALERARNLLGEQGDINVRRTAAEANLRDAELKLSYCKVYAPCDGYVVNLQITPGAYAAIGEQMFSIVDQRIWYVLANFRETDLKHMRPGMAVEIYLMAETEKKLKGYVQGVPKAIEALFSPSNSAPGGQGLLSQVSPTLDFILLAQRYPVRIVIDEPEGHSFRMGGTAAVIVHTKSNIDMGLERLKKLQQVDYVDFQAPLGGAARVPLHE